MTSPEITQLADDIETSLWKDLIDPWFPACVDAKGGFWQVFDRGWQRKTSNVRGVVFQSRMTWVAAALAALPGDRQEEFAATARHGAEYVSALFIEPTTGAVRFKIEKSDPPRPEETLEGHAYGAAFAIFALSSVHRHLGDTQPLDDAKKVFGWLENHVHDAVNGGYYECVSSRGEPVLVAPRKSKDRVGDEIGTPYGQKSQNTHLHLLEAFAELAKSWRDPIVLERLAELMEILEEKLYDPAGWLQAFTKPDWTPVPDRVSYGHDIEAAHLLLDAGETLSGTANEKTIQRARSLIDNTLMFGMDRENGGFYTNGTPGGRPLLRSKSWWVQAEALYGLAKGTQLPDANVDEYLDAVLATWNWIRSFQIDLENSGWFELVQTDGTEADPEEHKDRKGHMWKAAYHETRALIETAKILRGLAIAEDVEELPA